MTLVCRDLDLDPKRYQPNAVLHWVSNHKNELRDPEEAAKDARNSFEESYAAAYTLYQRRLREANALDFDDLIMTTVHLLQAFPEVRETYRRRFRHVLVDEYQDTNHAQYALIHQLCADSMEDPSATPRETSESPQERVEPSELMVVGDADQSIYAFRGANIRNILDFEQDFPDATSILLEQNYRSTQTILTAANAVIGHNKGRKPKKLWSDAGDGARIVGYVADDEHDEARFVSEEIDRLTDEGGTAPGRRRRLLPHQRAVPGVRGGVHPGRHALQGRRRGPLLRAPRGPRRPRLPADAGQPGRRDLAAPDPQHAQARHRRPGRSRASRRWPTASGSCSGRRCAGPRTRPAWPPARSTRSTASWGWSRSSSRWSTPTSGPTWSSSRCSPAPATSPSSRPPTTRRTTPGSRTSPSWSPSPASSPTTPWPARRPTRPTSTPALSRRGSGTSWSGSRSSPTPTRSPMTQTVTTPASSP